MLPDRNGRSPSLRGLLEGDHLRHHRLDGAWHRSGRHHSLSCGCPTTRSCAASRSSIRGSSDMPRLRAARALWRRDRAALPALRCRHPVRPADLPKPSALAGTAPFWSFSWNGISSTIWVGIRSRPRKRPYMAEIARGRASCRSTRASRARQRKRWACRQARRCGGSSCPGRCGSSCPRPATRPSPWSGHLAPGIAASIITELCFQARPAWSNSCQIAWLYGGRAVVPHRLHGPMVGQAWLERSGWPRLRHREEAENRESENGRRRQCGERAWYDIDRPQGGTPLVHAVNVTKSFGNNQVLKGIDMDVHKGEVVCFLGPVGFGQDDFPALHQPVGRSTAAGSGSTAT